MNRPFDLHEVVSVMAGLRPLVAAGKLSETKQISRDYEIETQSGSGLISIMGGKWTVYRAMAEETINAAEKQFSRARHSMQNSVLSFVRGRRQTGSPRLNN